MERLILEYAQWGETMLLPFPADCSPPATVESEVSFQDNDASNR